MLSSLQRLLSCSLRHSSPAAPRRFLPLLRRQATPFWLQPDCQKRALNSMVKSAKAEEKRGAADESKEVESGSDLERAAGGEQACEGRHLSSAALDCFQYGPAYVIMDSPPFSASP
jgi:hypothetical protein